MYGKKGIEFDEIWAWEVTNLDPSKYWAEIPKSIKPKLHFYNEPVTPDANDPANPMNHIKRAARPGDFVVGILNFFLTPNWLGIISTYY